MYVESLSSVFNLVAETIVAAAEEVVVLTRAEIVLPEISAIREK